MQNELDPQVVNLAKAIRQHESQGNFNARGASGEYGAYQYTPDTWKSDASKVGVTTPLDKATPAEQNKVAYYAIKELKDKGYNVAQVASVWNSGKPDPNATGTGTNKYGVKYDVPAYVNAVADYYQKFKAETQGTQAPTQQPVENMDTKSAQEYGAWFPSKEGDSAITSGLKAVGNLIPSIYNTGKGIISAVAHPIDTLSNIGNATMGYIQKAVRNTTGYTIDPTEAGQKAEQTAQGLNTAFSDRYGGLQNIQRSAVNDPFGVGLDVFSVLEGGAGLLGKSEQFANLASKPGQFIENKLASVTDKINPFTVKPNNLVIDAAERRNVTLPASSVNANPVVKQIESLAAKGAGAEKYMQTVEEATSKINEIANNLVRDTLGSEDLVNAGENIAKGVKDYVKQFKDTTEKLYTAFDKKGGNIAASPYTSIDYLNEVIKSKEAIGDEAGVKYFKTKLDVLTGSKDYKLPTFSTIKEIRTDVGKSIGTKFNDPFASKNANELKGFYESLSKDMDATIKSTGDSQLAKQFKMANDTYANGIQQINSAYGKKLYSFAAKGQYDKIVPAILSKSMSVQDIPKIIKIIGEENVKNLQSSLIDKIFTTAKGIDGNFTKGGITKAIKQVGEDKIRAILNDEQISTIQDLETLSKALNDGQSILKGSQTAFLTRQAATFGLAASAIFDLATGNWVSGISKLVPIIGDQAVSKFVTSETGRKILSKGYTPPPAVKKLIETSVGTNQIRSGVITNNVPITSPTVSQDTYK